MSVLDSLISDRKKFIETLLVIEDKSQKRVPFILNPIQCNVQETQTGRDIYVKPAQVGFSSERFANAYVATVTTPSTNTVLIAYEEFITQRLLDKMQFYHNSMMALNIPGFPKMHHSSSYEKTFPSIHSSIYISSARSYVAGRAETIHHLLADEFAFWEPGATERIFAPALDRVPPTGTVDIFSTPNGEDNDFCDMYRIAKAGESVFTAHFYPWFVHPEYSMPHDHPILTKAPNWARELTIPELKLDSNEENLATNYNLTMDQIRWRRYKIREKESLRRSGDMIKLFQQEFPEDDISCFLAAGDMYYDTDIMGELTRDCHTAPMSKQVLHNFADVWYPPEDNRWYILAIDPGQAKITRTAMVVLAFDKDDNPTYCARAAGLWEPETTALMAMELGKYYNSAVITWEANSHGLALAPLLKNYPNLYYRRDVVSGIESHELGWYTSGGARGTKEYMLATMRRMLPRMRVHDVQFISECRNIRTNDGKTVSVGMDDIHDACCIGLVCRDSRPIYRGFVGTSGFKW